MSALVREQILERLDTPGPEQLTISPLLDRDKQVGAGSVDLRLGTEFLETPRQSIELVDPFRVVDEDQPLVEDRRTYVPLGNRYVLHPGQFVLGSSLEFIVMPADLTGQVLSRSSWGRVGLLVATAVAVQPGFRGMLTLELVNSGAVPIVLHPGLRVAQLQLWASSSATERPYNVSGKYDAPLGPQSNRLVSEKSEREVLRQITQNLHPGHAED